VRLDERLVTTRPSSLDVGDFTDAVVCTIPLVCDRAHWGHLDDRRWRLSRAAGLPEAAGPLLAVLVAS
jgi:hypothetical protein